MGEAFRVSGQLNKAVDVLEQGASAVRERASDLQCARARLLSDTNQNEQAIDILHHVTLADPHHVEAWANLGLALHRQGSVEDAVEAFRRALELAPDHYWANHLLARLLVQWRLWEEVAQLERHAIKVAPDDEARARSMILLASASLRLDDIESACKFFTGAYEVLQEQPILDDIRSLGCEK